MLIAAAKTCLDKVKCILERNGDFVTVFVTIKIWSIIHFALQTIFSPSDSAVLIDH